jgi:outer membrane protein assembly complex protein YaeT
MNPILNFQRSILTVIFLVLLWLPMGVGAQDALVIESLQFWGNEEIATSILKAQMLTKATPWYGFMPFVKPRKFDAGLFHSDVQRLLNFYHTKGYHQAQIDTTLEQRKNGHIFAKIRIDEGPQSHFGMFQVLGLDSHRKRDQEVVADLQRLVGEPFVQTHLAEEVTKALRVLRNEGFAFAKAEVSTVTDSLLINVDVVFELGPMCTVSEILIGGNVGVSERTILRGLTFGEGEIFEGNQLDDSRRQLYRAGVFRGVRIDLPDTVAQYTPVRVNVSERPFRSITLGGGYDTEIGLRASAAWLHRNFGGGARQLRLSGTVSAASRDVVVGIREPYFFGGRNWLNLSGFIQRREQAGTEQDELGGSTSFERNITERLDFVLQFSGGVVASQTDSAFSEVRAALRWDKRDDIFDPHKGFLASLTVRERGWWLRSPWEFWEVTTEGRWFQPLPLQNVLGVRLVGGAIFQINSRAEVPTIERYYSGGLNSVRGWNYQELGPKEIRYNAKDDKDEIVPLGGTSHLEGSVELRTTLLRFFGTALFVDAARVDNELDAFSLPDLLWSVGGGLRLLTPVGPVRFDVGYRISDDPVLDSQVDFDSRWRFHLSLGQAF